MQGTTRSEWHALYKGCNVADGRLSSRPEGGPQMTQSSVAVLDKGVAIACAPQEVPLGCELRLVLSNLWASENVKQYETLH